MDSPNPKKIINQIQRGREKLGKENMELKRLGQQYSDKRGEYKKEYAKVKYKAYNTEGESAAGADTIANGRVANLRAEYESTKVMWETQKEVCRHIAEQLSALQSIKNAMEEELKNS